MATPVTRALVIGCGSIGSRHLRNLAALGVPELLAFDTDAERAAQAVAQVDGARVIETLALGWEAAPHLAVIASPTALHVPLARAAVAAGANVYMEKPVSADVEGVDELVAECSAAGLIGAVGYNWRFNPMIRRVAEVLGAGTIGRPLSLRAHFGSYLPARHPWEDYRVGYGARADLGGGVILDAVTHQLDYLVSMLGWPDSVSCRAGKRSDLEIDVEDVADLALDFSGGVVATIHGDFVERPHRAALDIIGSEGTLLADFVGSELRVWSSSTEQWATETFAFDYNDIYLDLMRHVLDCAATGAKPSTDLADGARNLRILLAAKRSAETGEVISL